MLAGPLLLTWLLLGTVTRTQCQGTVCHPVPTPARATGPHRLATFPDRAACDLYRTTLAQQYPMVVQPQPHRPDVTVRTDMTLTCTLEGDTP